MKNKYDYIFITNVPAFYKINLYNNLSDKLNIKVIFISKTSSIRNDDFVTGDMRFDHEFICEGNYEKRNKIICLYRIIRIISQCQYRKIVYPGWELVELILPIFLLRKSKNCMVVESSIKESRTSGLVWWFKKLLINRMDSIFPSGKLQSDIMIKAGYKGRSYFTHGVGVPQRNSERHIKKISKSNEFNYLYVGRLSGEKNLNFLIDYFNYTGKNLTLVGTGELFNKLKSTVKDNIKLLGYIPNNELHKIYQSHDCFILPSLSEPWGLVVDEALWNGMPILASDQVGCLHDLVLDPKTGLSFNPLCFGSLDTAIFEMENNYCTYIKNVNNINFHDRDRMQIVAYELGLENEI